MTVQYKYPNAVVSVWHYRYSQKEKRFITIVNDTYSYVEFDQIITQYDVKEGDFIEYGTNSGGGGVFQVRSGAPYAPSWGWSNDRAFNTAHGDKYLVPPTDKEMEKLSPIK